MEHPRGNSGRWRRVETGVGLRVERAPFARSGQEVLSAGERRRAAQRRSPVSETRSARDVARVRKSEEAGTHAALDLPVAWNRREEEGWDRSRRDVQMRSSLV